MTVIFRPPAVDPHGPQHTPPDERRETAFKPRKTTVRMGPDPLSAEATQNWFKAQNVYPNLAGDEEIAARAVSYVRSQRTWMQQRNYEVRQKWEIIDWLLRGNSISSLFPESEIHVPELYKSVETLVPRIIEAILQYTPWFKVGGTDREDRQRAKRIQAWLQYQIKQDHFEERVEEWVRALVVYQFFALKTRWHIETRKQVVREHTMYLNEKGEAITETTAEEKEILVYEGLKTTLVDPYNFLCDTSRTDPQEMSFIGDTSRMLETEMQQYEKMGLWTNLARAFEQTPNQRDTISAAYAQDLRSLDSSHTFMRTKKAEGEPAEYNVTELWCKWQPRSDMPIDEYVITVVEDGIAVRVQKNPYDDKHRPYCIARASKEPFDFWNVGVLDHAIRIQNEMDDQENLAVMGHRLAICPIVHVGSDWDGPSNLFHTQPGQVFATEHPPTFHRSSSTIGEHLAMKENLRREIEETVGVPRVWEGSDRSNTATEIERKIQESNRRLRRLILSVSDGLTQMLHQTWSYTRQYVSEKRVFRVLGAAAKELGVAATLELEDLGDPADIEIRGLRGQQSHGLRATQITTFLTQMGPLLPMLVETGDLNVPGLARELFEALLGYELDQDILPIKPSLDDLMTAEREDMMMVQGIEMRVNDHDNHDDHIPKHRETQSSLGSSPDEQLVDKILEEHIQSHENKKARDSMKRAAMENSLQQFQSGQAAQQLQGGNTDGRGGRQPDLMGDVPQGTPPGETPGPPRAEAFAAPDRTQPVPQTQNRS